MSGYLTVSFFCFGVLIVLTYAWQRFNEPSFPNEETLPRTVEPLRYLFLKPAYAKARLLYLVGLLVLYALLVVPGPSMVGALGGPGPKEGLSPQAWPLLIALILTGLGTAPTPVKWLNFIEEQLRRWVHAWYLVPDGIRSTIAVLDDARYDPPASQLSFLQDPLKEKCQEDMRLAQGTLGYSWARATILVTSIKSMLNGAPHPLKRVAFEPFKDEFFDDILVTYRALKLDVQALNPNDEDEEEKLSRSVEKLLKRVYAYISWGIRYQVDSEREVDQILKELGFRIPDRVPGRHLFEIVVPAVLLISAIVTAFGVASDAICRAMGATDCPLTIYKSIDAALSSAMAASLMYGAIVWIVLKHRAAKIEQKVWREGSWRCLIPIALKAGLATWLVIVLSTVYWKPSDAWQSLIGMAQLVVQPTGANASTAPDWSFLPTKMGTALPWLLVGMTASICLVIRLSGDVRRIGMADRVRDGIVVAAALGIAAAVAQLIQTSFVDQFRDLGWTMEPLPSNKLVCIEGLAEFACGAVIGLVVPLACRANIVTPSDPATARALRVLQRDARTMLGSTAAGDEWVFTPNDDLRGITPAEALQYRTHATGVGNLLEIAAQRQLEEKRSDRSDRPAPVAPADGAAAAAAASHD
ncbi:MAG: hypothetical protein JO283_19260 [Bradyrhizobium sp.]|nr:hypothetical protein [Bradyrhizobium sp.]